MEESALSLSAFRSLTYFSTNQPISVLCARFKCAFPSLSDFLFALNRLTTSQCLDLSLSHCGHCLSLKCDLFRSFGFPFPRLAAADAAFALGNVAKHLSLCLNPKNGAQNGRSRVKIN